MRRSEEFARKERTPSKGGTNLETNPTKCTESGRDDYQLNEGHVASAVMVSYGNPEHHAQTTL
jgi:hypothetical protein